ncbi:MAG: uroporphyrinogen-III C-methyltransferase, partial [Pseudomonadota bacterium]
LAEAVATPNQSLKRSTVAELATHLSGQIGSHPALILYGPLAEGDPA